MNDHSGRLKKVHRLARPEEFKHVFASRCRSRDKNFLVLANKNNKRHSRLGLAISKKAIQSAAKRNRVKRIIREFFRLHKIETARLDIVVVANKTISESNSNNLVPSLSKHWQRIQQCNSF